MKLLMSNKKLNLNINVLPDKYRWHFIKFKYVVAILLVIVGAAAALLAYQVVVDAYAATDGLYVQRDELNDDVSTMLKVNTQRASMQQTINEYSSLTIFNGVMLNDVTRLYEIGADSILAMEQVEYSIGGIIVTVAAFDDTAGYSWDVWVENLEAFAVALRDDERFLLVTYEDPDFAAGEFFPVEFTVISARLRSS